MRESEGNFKFNHNVLPLIFPLAGDLYRLRSNWHVKRSKKRCSADHSYNKKRRAHNGVDIGSKLGIPVYSCVKGKVIPAPYEDFPVDRYGTSVWIQSRETGSEGYQFLYAHLDQVFVEPGQLVENTTQIGTIGLTGNSLRPHLHFEIHCPSGQSFICPQCQPRSGPVTSLNPYQTLFKASNRNKTEADILAERQKITLLTTRTMVKKLMERILPR